MRKCNLPCFCSVRVWHLSGAFRWLSRYLGGCSSGDTDRYLQETEQTGAADSAFYAFCSKNVCRWNLEIVEPLSVKTKEEEDAETLASEKTCRLVHLTEYSTAAWKQQQRERGASSALTVSGCGADSWLSILLKVIIPSSRSPRSPPRGCADTPPGSSAAGRILSVRIHLFHTLTRASRECSGAPPPLTSSLSRRLNSPGGPESKLQIRHQMRTGRLPPLQWSVRDRHRVLYPADQVCVQQKCRTVEPRTQETTLLWTFKFIYKLFLLFRQHQWQLKKSKVII